MILMEFSYGCGVVVVSVFSSAFPSSVLLAFPRRIKEKEYAVWSGVPSCSGMVFELGPTMSTKKRETVRKKLHRKNGLRIATKRAFAHGFLPDSGLPTREHEQRNEIALRDIRTQHPDGRSTWRQWGCLYPVILTTAVTAIVYWISNRWVMEIIVLGE